MKIKKWVTTLALFWTLICWLIFVALPLFMLIVHAWKEQKATRLFFDDSILSVVKMTVFQAICSTALSSLIGLWIGLKIGSIPSKKIRSGVQILFSIPYGIPTVVVGMAWVIWLGRSGIVAQWGWRLDWIYSLKAVILAHVVLNVPLVALMVSQARERMNALEVSAAQTLGAGRWAQFRCIFWPNIYSAFVGASAQVMVVCSMSFALVLFLGGGPPAQTLETEIYSRLRYGAVDLSGAIVLAGWEFVITLLPWLIVLFTHKKQISGAVSRDSSHFQLRPAYKLNLVFFLLLGLIWVLPYFAVFSKGMIRLLTDPRWQMQISGPLILSLKLAFGSSFGSVTTAFLSIIALAGMRNRLGLTRLINGFLVLPGGVSAFVLGLGVWLTYGQWFDFFEGNYFVIGAIQATLFFPIAYRLLWPLLDEMESREWDAAISLGASLWQAFRWVEWPKWRGPIFSAFAAVGGASLGEVAAVSLFYHEDLIPLPLLISRWMSQYRFEEAQGVAGILLLLCTTSIIGLTYGLVKHAIRPAS